MAGAYVNLAQRFFSAFGSGFTQVHPTARSPSAA
jgi:hypothetical protein